MIASNLRQKENLDSGYWSLPLTTDLSTPKICVLYWRTCTANAYVHPQQNSRSLNNPNGNPVRNGTFAHTKLCALFWITKIALFWIMNFAYLSGDILSSSNCKPSPPLPSAMWNVHEICWTRNILWTVWTIYNCLVCHCHSHCSK